MILFITTAVKTSNPTLDENYFGGGRTGRIPVEMHSINRNCVQTN
jgi:hypothetical protein